MKILQTLKISFLCIFFFLINSFIVGCGYHYEVSKKVDHSPQKEMVLDTEVRALRGRLNGYALYLENQSKEKVIFNWDQVKIRQENGFEVPTYYRHNQSVNSLHPNGKIYYHFVPKHRYQVKPFLTNPSEQF